MPKNKRVRAIPENLQGVTRFDIQISDVEPINKLFSKCFIKILYPGLNRNNVYIEKEVANEMAKTLTNIPIVGEYIEHKDDFGTHGGRIEITDEDIKFIQTTKPWGFIPESTEISWQNVTEEDGTTREYLTCVGYLWSGRYPEILDVLNSGRPQSMELFEDTLEGYWARQEGREYFHITKADFSALCILGNDVEPAFESADIGSYFVSNPISFSKKYNKLLRDFEESLPDIVNFSSSANKQNEGGSNMKLQFTFDLDDDNIKIKMYEVLNEKDEDGNFIWKYSIIKIEDDNIIYIDEATNQAYKRNYTIEEDVVTFAEEIQEIEIGEPQEEDRSEIEALQQQFTELNEKYEAAIKQEDNNDATLIDELQKQNQELREFKEKVETEEKEEVINEFAAVLESEVIDDFKTKIKEYTKIDLEKELALIAYRKKVNFSHDSQSNLIPDKENIDDGISGSEKIIRKYYK